MKTLLKPGVVAGLLCVAVLPMQAGTEKVANEPDSVYLFSYARADGQSGLR